MIGTNIRSIRHLFRVSNTSVQTVLMKFEQGNWDFCKVVKFPKESSFSEMLFIFNNYYHKSNWSVPSFLSISDIKKYDITVNDLAKYSHILQISGDKLSRLNNVFKEIILLPEDFDNKYEKFLQENSKLIKSLKNNYGISQNDVKVKMMYIFTEGSKNFFNWAITTYYKNGISLSTIRNILSWNETYSQFAKNLSKSTITAYTSKNSILVLMDELSEIRKAKRINDSINSFNTAQKKMLKENEITNDIKQALWKLSRLSETKRLNFIKKISSVTDYNEFIRQLKFVTSVHFSWNKESFLDYIDNVEGIKYEKIFENESIILVKVLDYETVKQLGKTTNWCISKNKKYWNDYIESQEGRTTQYMVFNFSKMEDDKLSIIGFTTTKNKGITSAHNFVNDNLMNNNNNDEIPPLLNSFIEKFKTSNNIYSILDNNGIDITMVIEYDKPCYEWSEDGVLSYLYECVDKANVEILKKSDGKMVLSVIDDDICHFFGDSYHDNIDSYYYNLQHLIFIDFKKSKYDNTKIQFAIIDENSGCEEYCVNIFNEFSTQVQTSFDSLLVEYGLPYNIIKRIEDPSSKLKNAIVSFNTTLIKESMKNCSKMDLVNTIKNDLSYDYFFDLLTQSIVTYVSFDYLNLIYDNELTLGDIMPQNYIGSLIKNIAKNFSRNAVDEFANMGGVTDNEITEFFNGSLTRKETVKYVGYYLAIKTILEHENIKGEECNKTFVSFLDYIRQYNACEIYEQIFNLIKDNFDYDKKDDAIYCIAEYACSRATNEFQNFINQKATKHKGLHELVQKFESKKSQKQPKYTSYSIEVPEFL